MSWQLNIDGGARGNPGPAGAGVVLKDERERPRFEAGFYLGRATNNQAEYRALLLGLDAAGRANVDVIAIFSDSELLVKQITGEYRVKAAGLVPLLEQAQQKMLKFNWQIRHVRRENNKRADELANMAMDKQADVVVLDEVGGDEKSKRSRRKTGGGNNGAAKGMGEAAIENARGPDLTVTARTTTASDASACPAPCRKGQTFVFDTRMPEGLCVMAARAMLQTVLSVQYAGFEKGELPPPVTVRCSRERCGAAWELKCK